MRVIKTNRNSHINMKKILSLIGIAIFCAATTQAQKPVIKFDKEAYDFGEIKEADGPVTVDFNYQNTGATPLVLHSVQASCGCTTPEWTRTPIQPNGTGVIKVTFNPENRPGTFSKTITVQSNAQSAVKTLRITGNVLQKPKTLQDEYPVNFEGLRLTDSHMPFTKMAPNETKIAEIKVVNTLDSALTPRFVNVPKHVKIAAIPATIQPGEYGIIQANYDAAAKNDWGFVSDQVYVTFSDKKKYTNRLNISATIAEDFSSLTEEQLANAPVIEFNEKSFDFGEITQGQKVEHDFTVSNKGKENLIIRKVKASCGCTAVKPEKTVLEENETTTIHVTFDSRGKSGRQQKTVTIISNDPKQSNILLRISGTVNSPGADVVK